MNHFTLAALPVLAAGLLAQGTPEVEPNDSSATATVVAIGAQADGAIDVAGDFDYYAITLSSDSDLRVWTNPGIGASFYDSDLTLFDVDGSTVLAFNDDIVESSLYVSFFSRIVVGNLPAGTYFVMVRSSQVFEPDDTGSYTLDVVAAPVGTYVTTGAGTPTLVGERPEDNDPRNAGGVATASHPDSINFGDISSATLGASYNDPAADYDFYRIVVPAAGTLTMSTRGGIILPMSDTVIFLADSSLNLIDFDDDSGPGLYSLLSAQVTAGVYFVAVKGWNTGSCELVISLGTPLPIGSATVTTQPGGCGPALGTRVAPLGPVFAPEVPVLGSTFYLDGQTNLASASVLRLIGLGILGTPFDLGTLGAPGCLIELDIAGLEFAVADANGIDYWPISSPISVTFVGLPIEQQLAVLDLAANGLGMTVSNRVSAVFGITN